jgi:predicted aconitase with swiveling domain
MRGGAQPLVLTGHPGVGAAAEGEALVSTEGFSARYDLDRATGRICRASHPLYGQALAGKVFVCPLAKGGFATSWALYDLRSRGLAPAAMLFGWANPVMVQGAVLAGIALMDQLTPDPVATISTGDWVRVDPRAGRVEVWRGSGLVFQHPAGEPRR